MSAPRLIVPPGGGGGGTVTGTGTPGKLAKWTAATTVGDSGISDDGATVSFVARDLASTASSTTWTLGNPNSFALIVKSNSGPQRTLVLDTLSRAVGVGGAPGTLVDVTDNAGYPFAGSRYEGVRLQRSSEAIFSASDYTLSFRAGITGGTAVVGTSTAHDLLLQRGNVTAITLGASGAVTFAGNLTSNVAQTWTLAAGSTSALNIASNLLNLDTTNSRVGIGTASPAARLHSVSADGTYQLALAGTTKGIRFQTTAAQAQIDGVDNTLVASYQPLAINGSTLSFLIAGAAKAGINGSSQLYVSSAGTAVTPVITESTGVTGFFFPSSTTLAFSTNAAERARIDSSGNVGIGTTSPTDRLTISGGGLAITGNITGATTAANSLAMDNAGGTSRFYSIGASAAAFGNYVFNASKSGGSPGAVVACTIDQAAGVLLGSTSTAVFNAFTLGQGIKLWSTPVLANTDPNTLDCYAESIAGSWAPTLTGFGGTAPTVTAARYTRIGRLVSLQLHLSAVTSTTFSSVAGSTFVSLPAGMTPPVSAPGATSNSGISADGPCVAYTNGNFYLPTFALRADNTFLNVTYTV